MVGEVKVLSELFSNNMRKVKDIIIIQKIDYVGLSRASGEIHLDWLNRERIGWEDKELLRSHCFSYWSEKACTCETDNWSL